MLKAIVKGSEMENVVNGYADMLKTNTKRAYTADIRDFMASVDGFTLENVISYFNKTAIKYAESTINRKKAALNSFLNYLVELNMIPSNPLKTSVFKLYLKKYTSKATKDHVSNKPQKHSINGSEITKLLEVAGDGLRAMRDQAVIFLGTKQGLRRSEIAALKWTDITADSTGYILTVRGSKNGKTDKIKLFEGVYNSLIALKKEYSRYNIFSDHVIVSLAYNSLGDPLTPDSINKIVKTLAKKAQITNYQEITAHDLRHTFAVELYRSGVKLNTISKMLRHQDIKTTSVYLETLNIYDDQALNNLAW